MNILAPKTRRMNALIGGSSFEILNPHRWQRWLKVFHWVETGFLKVLEDTGPFGAAVYESH